jgi:hypothetical protein
MKLVCLLICAAFSPCLTAPLDAAALHSDPKTSRQRHTGRMTLLAIGLAKQLGDNKPLHDRQAAKSRAAR